MNFSESTVERGLTHHCYQKHKLHATLIWYTNNRFRNLP